MQKTPWGLLWNTSRLGRLSRRWPNTSQNKTTRFCRISAACCQMWHLTASHFVGLVLRKLFFFLRSHRKLGRKESGIDTLGLSRGAVGISQGQERGLHQLAEKHVFSHQDELSVLFSVVIFQRAVQLLHHTEDRNHQTWEDTIQQQNTDVTRQSGPPGGSGQDCSQS